MIAIVKPVGNYCNLRCEYCFYHGQDQSDKELMSDKLLEKFLTEMRSVNDCPTIIWHGGEPLLAGAGLYQTALEMEARLWGSGRVKNLIQTNATLITPELARFFREHRISPGVSLDGCPEQHNTFRKTVDGRGSHEATLNGIRVLQSEGVTFGIIQTVAKDTLRYVADSFDYLHQVVGARSISLNVFHAGSTECEWVRTQSISDEEWGDYLKIIFKKWLEANDKDLVIREIETAVQGAVGKMPKACRFNGTCGHYFCLQPNGDVYPCDRFITDKDRWGNLNRQSLAEILSGEERRTFRQQNEASYHHCSECGWIGSCHNGCGSQRVGGLDGKFYYCDSSKRLFESAAEALRKIQQ